MRCETGNNYIKICIYINVNCEYIVMSDYIEVNLNVYI